MLEDDYTTNKEYAYDFIKLLSKFKQINEEIEENNNNNREIILKSPTFYSFSNFKTIVCELFYQALQSMPHIITYYNITCTSNKGKSEIQIGVFDDIDDEGEISIAKIIHPECLIILNKEVVHNIYIANRSNFYDHETVSMIMMMLYMDGYEPTITTSFISAKRNTKF